MITFIEPSMKIPEVGGGPSAPALSISEISSSVSGAAKCCQLDSEGDGRDSYGGLQHLCIPRGVSCLNLSWSQGVNSMRKGWLGRVIRYYRNTLGADPGEDDLSRCSSEALRGCKNRFIDRTTRVTGNRTSEMLSVNGHHEGNSGHTQGHCKLQEGCCVRQRI